MSLTVLSVAYPLAPVSTDSAGGAEQVLAMLDRALVEAGHRSIVVAQEGSRVAGRLVPTPRPDGLLDDAARASAQARTRAAVATALAETGVDVVHLHGIDFFETLPPPGVPTLATLHLPPDWYPPAVFAGGRPGLWLHAVSAIQHAACPPCAHLLPPIENGVDVDALQAIHARRSFALFLGRICWEKGVHIAIEAARRAGVPLLIAGEVYPYEAHRHYFEEHVRPHLGPACRFLGPVGFARKRRLLSAARCLLVPALAAETSSLVAREAAACGTPVVAFPAGALAQAVDEARTGFLVPDAAAMAVATGRCASIDPATCRDHARRRFSATTTIARYLERYAVLASQRASAA